MKNINLKEFSKEELKLLIEEAIKEIERPRLTEREKEFLSFFEGVTIEKRLKPLCLLFYDTDEQKNTRIDIAYLKGLSFEGLEEFVSYNINDLTNKDYRITLTEFWESSNKLAIHCDTKEKVEVLCKAFHKIGEKWCDGENYLNNSCWNYNQRTYYANDNHYGIGSDYENWGYNIFNFDEIDLEG